MPTAMAARRKSLKPTNKIYHQLQVDDDVDDDMDESTSPGVSASNIPSARDSTHKNALTHVPNPSQRTPPTRSAVFDLSSLPGQFLTLSQAAEPHIALPSDIYQDFEALKSATNMDTTELMRKLLTDFHKISSSNQSPPERKLDDVINDLFPSRSTNALDLSKRKRADRSFCSYDPGSSSATIISHGYTDDQLAMGILDKVEVVDESIDLKPLDLTLQKNQSDSASGDNVLGKRKTTQIICPSLFKPFSPSKEDSHCPQSFKHAGSYVINLEPGNESPQLVNSSLAQVLRMDIPLHSFGSGNKCTTSSQEALFLTEATNASSNFKKNSSEGSVQLCQSNFRSKLFQDDTETSKLFKIGNNETASDSGLSSLPSYAEAVTSVIKSQHSKRATGALIQESLAGVQGLEKVEQEPQSGGVSFVHMNTEDSDIKMFPLNLNSHLITNANSPESHPKQQHNLLHQLLQHQLNSENKSLQRQLQNASTTQAQQHQNTITTFCGGSMSHVQMMQVPGIKSDLNDVQGLTQAIKSNDIQYPNFLLESQSVGLPSIPTALSNVSVASSTLPNTSMPMSTFFMTTSANGGVGHMVAIPVIHAVSDGIAGLQPFAFAPHPMALTNSISSKTTRSPDDISSVSQQALPGSISSPSKKSNKPQNQEFLNSGPFTSEASMSPSLGAVKSKPGRPRGRGGRGQSQKTLNKDMKLLTENTLFPGVYTSILKLPWSRRSRNKTKTKNISELKKQAQISAHSRVNEGEPDYNGEGDRKEECTEQDNNNVNNNDQICLQRKIEMIADNQKFEQDLLDHNQRHQIQHQKLKDLEQQQRLHMQYHLRLQEEQQKLTKQIEQSYLNLNSDSPVQIQCAASSEQAYPDKQETQNLGSLQRECSDMAVSVGSIVSSDSIPFTPPLLSQDPVMMVYSNDDMSTPKKTPRKRGRPPKVPNLPSKTIDNHLPFNTTSSLPNSVVKYEPENFLHTNVLSSNGVTVSADTNPQNSLSVFPQHLLVSEIDKCPSVIPAHFDIDREITLENKINFLTNKIGLELSQSMVAQSSGVPTMNITQTIKCENESDDTMYQEMKLAINKSLVDVKPRRKKVSRLLKSDENFMYATFKIKPKGLTPRKSRKRRKDVEKSTAVVAETISNLRQKALRDCVTSRSEADPTKPPSMVAWKFHEQYPCSNEEEDSKDRRIVCVKCGNCFAYESDDVVSRECETCLTERAEFTTGLDPNKATVNKAGKVSATDSELKAECCMNCGDVFQKHFSDPSARCDVCQNNAPRVIQSSKLFSFQDSPTDLAQTTPKTARATSPLAASELSLRDKRFSEKGLAKINNNHLFCSLCRMEFSKICDYLAHIRDTHETKLGETTQFLSSTSDQNRKMKVSKTKKSLAHKTLTCPVEECPHFFREQKDLDLHFMKKHSNLSICFQGNAYTHPDEQDVPVQPDMLTSESSLQLAHGINNTGQDILTNHEKTRPAASTCEKPLQCEFCAYRCRQKNALTWHMRKHPEAASQYRKYSNMNVD